MVGRIVEEVLAWAIVLTVVIASILFPVGVVDLGLYIAIIALPLLVAGIVFYNVSVKGVDSYSGSKASFIALLIVGFIPFVIAFVAKIALMAAGVISPESSQSSQSSYVDNDDKSSEDENNGVYSGCYDDHEKKYDKFIYDGSKKELTVQTYDSNFKNAIKISHTYDYGGNYIELVDYQGNKYKVNK
jgi:hypothetical protein